MKKDIFKQIVDPGDLVLILTKGRGRHIDSFNRDLVGIGIYKEIDDNTFYLCNVTAVENEMFSNMNAQQHFYDTISVVTRIKSANDIKKIIDTFYE